MKLLALVTVMLVALAQPVMSQSCLVVAPRDYKAGLAAYDRGDYATALEIWQPLAEQGNLEAKDALGFMYQYAGILWIDQSSKIRQDN